MPVKGVIQMKKTLILIFVCTLSLVFCLNSCSGHFTGTAAEADTPSPLARLLTLSEWDARGGGDGLEFRPGGTGVSGGAPFAWTEDGSAVTLRFFPEGFAGRTTEAAVSAGAGTGRLTLSCGGMEYAPAMLCAASRDAAEEAEPAEAQPTAEELLGREAADLALQFLGWKYKYGGSTPETGFDCSGFVCYIYGQLGYKLERVANDQAKQGAAIEPEDIMPGDLIAFHTSGKYVGHVGLYVGSGYYIHAMGEAYGVVLTSLENGYSQREYDVRRIIGCEELLISPPDA